MRCVVAGTLGIEGLFPLSGCRLYRQRRGFQQSPLHSPQPSTPQATPLSPLPSVVIAYSREDFQAQPFLTPRGPTPTRGSSMERDLGLGIRDRPLSWKIKATPGQRGWMPWPPGPQQKPGGAGNLQGRKKDHLGRCPLTPTPTPHPFPACLAVEVKVPLCVVCLFAQERDARVMGWQRLEGTCCSALRSPAADALRHPPKQRVKLLPPLHSLLGFCLSPGNPEAAAKPNRSAPVGRLRPGKEVNFQRNSST